MSQRSRTTPVPAAPAGAWTPAGIVALTVVLHFAGGFSWSLALINAFVLGVVCLLDFSRRRPTARGGRSC